MLLLTLGAWASDIGGAPVEAQAHEASTLVPKVPPPAAFKALVYAQTRGVGSNVVSTNPFLDGQVLGKLGGTNGLVTDQARRSVFVEQRASGFFTWRPDVLDGKVGITAAFEVDFAWGDRSYGVGGNTGGGFGADQVNLQTRRLQVDVWEKFGSGKHQVHGVLGLQFLADSSSDPSATTPDGLFRSGGRLMFFGSEASGASVYGRYVDDFGERFRYRLGIYSLLEQGLGAADDVWMVMADGTWHPSAAVEVGAHVWSLRDRAGGLGGPVGSGPSSGLSAMQGGTQLDPYAGQPRPENGGVDSDLTWIAVDAGYNAGLVDGPFGATALAVLNLGAVQARGGPTLPVNGQLLDVEARLRFAPGRGSILRAEALYSSPDDGNATNGYTGIITGNSYGFAGAVNNTHGTRLLFPDPGSVNRMAAVVYDVGGDLGVMGLTGSVAYDMIPDRLNARVGGGLALAPQRGSLGSEVNLTLTHEPMPFFRTYVAGAALFPGPEALVADTGWTTLIGLEWLAF